MDVALVGHSQLPTNLHVSGADISIYRAPGGRADEFWDDERMSDVLEEWQGDLVILWLGSSDIDEDTVPSELASNILDICENIENSCDAVVKICLIEPREYPDEDPISHEDYAKIQKAVNKKLRKAPYSNIHFNSTAYQAELAEDGVHFTSVGRSMIKSKLRNAIKSFMNDSDSD